MINERILFGYPIEFRDICFIYQIKNEDIISVNNNNFWMLYSLLTASFEDLYDFAREKAKKEKKKIDIKSIPMPWDNLWNMIKEDKESLYLVKKALELFVKTDVYFLPNIKEIIIGPIEEHRSINSNNFFEFQNALRSSVGQKELDPPNLKMHPKIMEMKAKARERDRIKAKQESGHFSFGNLLLNVCAMNVGINIDNILKQTYCMTVNLYKIGSKKEKFDIDIRSIIAGADPKKVKLKQWTNDDDDDDK